MARVPFIAATSLALALFTTAVADDGLPADLAARMAAFEKEFADLVAPVDENYVEALRSHEKQFAISKNYEAAIAARDERLSIENKMDSAPSPGNPGNDQTAKTSDRDAGAPLTFPALSSSGQTGAALEDDTLRFTKTEDAAEWTIEEVKPGAYEVQLTYAASAAATMRIQEYFFRLSGELPATKDEKTFEEHSLGVLKLTASATRLRLTATSGAALVKKVQLIPR